jgi:hypothetical protein
MTEQELVYFEKQVAAFYDPDKAKRLGVQPLCRVDLERGTKKLLVEIRRLQQEIKDLHEYYAGQAIHQASTWS